MKTRPRPTPPAGGARPDPPPGGAALAAAAARLKALAHPQRLRLFQLIRSGRHCCYVDGRAREAVPIGSCVGDLAAEFRLAPSTVSHHLKELRAAGLVAVSRRGQFLFCRADEGALAELVGYLRAAPGAGPGPKESTKRRPGAPIEGETDDDHP